MSWFPSPAAPCHRTPLGSAARQPSFQSWQLCRVKSLIEKPVHAVQHAHSTLRDVLGFA
jgi:hypothetical protein